MAVLTPGPQPRTLIFVWINVIIGYSISEPLSPFHRSSQEEENECLQADSGRSLRSHTKLFAPEQTLFHGMSDRTLLMSNWDKKLIQKYTRSHEDWFVSPRVGSKHSNKKTGSIFYRSAGFYFSTIFD